MQVLMPEVTSEGAMMAARALRQSGHGLATCESDLDGRCVALRGGRCPLETAPVDAVLVVRAAADASRLPGEDVVLCAARRKVPVVLAGATAHHPYADLVTADDDGVDVVTTLETVHDLPLEDQTVAANIALHACLTRHDVPDPRAHARVYRRGGRLLARLHFDGTTPAPSTVQAAAVRVAGAVRAVDPWAGGVDISADG